MIIFKSIKRVFPWVLNCLWCSCLFILFLSCTTDKKNYANEMEFQLASPSIQIDSLLFKNAATVTIPFTFPNAEVRYTLDGSDVTSSALVYTSPFQIRKSALLKVKSFHPNFNSSKEIKLDVMHVSKDISNATVKITPEPHSTYKGEGVFSLIDLQKGTTKFREGSQWLGFQSEVITIHLNFEQALTFSKVILSTLNDQNNWIFLPKSIEVRSKNKIIGRIQLENAEEKQKSNMKFVPISIRKGSYTDIDLIIQPVLKIPTWHPGSGASAWFFIDELVVE